jgi:lysophospholipase L1-like esterase
MKFLLPFLFAASLGFTLRAEDPKPATPSLAKPAAPADPFAKWEKEIAGIEAADKKNPPAKGAIVFTGSSTIRMWKSLAQDYPQHQVVNHGFGGSEIADCTHFADRLVFPIEPKVIFLRAGGNDINAGKTPEQVFENYKAFVATVHAKLPEAEIIYIGLAPTIARIKQVDAGNKLDDLIKDYAAKNPKLKYIDCANLSVGADGQPRPELFIKDGLHFSDAGYKLLAERVRPFMPPVK